MNVETVKIRVHIWLEEKKALKQVLPLNVVVYDDHCNNDIMPLMLFSVNLPSEIKPYDQTNKIGCIDIKTNYYYDLCDFYYKNNEHVPAQLFCDEYGIFYIETTIPI